MSSYPLLTGRLLIEPLGEQDLGGFVAYRCRPEIARWQSWESGYGQSDAEALLAAQPAGDVPDAGGWMQLAVRSLEDGLLYGDIAIGTSGHEPDTYELGATFDPAYQGEGRATEAAGRVLAFLFNDLRAHRVTAFCDTRNSGAQGVLQRIGLRHESHQVEAEFLKGEWTTVDGYALLAEEYRARSAPR